MLSVGHGFARLRRRCLQLFVHVVCHFVADDDDGDEWMEEQR